MFNAKITSEEFYILLTQPLKLGWYSNLAMSRFALAQLPGGSLPLYHSNFGCVCGGAGIDMSKTTSEWHVDLWGGLDCLLYNHGLTLYCCHWRNEELPSFSEG